MDSSVGCSAGTVALWDLHSRSSLLYTSSPTEGATLRPFENFAAHTAQTTGVKFCPQNRQFLGTCSHDRCDNYCGLCELLCNVHRQIRDINNNGLSLYGACWNKCVYITDVPYIPG